MSERFASILAERGIIRIAGEDARDFLQGLISNDIRRVTPDCAIYSALLTPQGKFLFDFFISEIDGALMLETERDRLPDLIKRLTMYKLRAKATLEDVSDVWRVVACWGDGVTDTLGLADDAGAAKALAGGVAYCDPRLKAAGARLLLAADAPVPEGLDAADATPADYDAHRLALGLPDGSRDLVVEKAILMESGFDELNGVDWKKGCYMGQELTARTKYRGLVKKRLVPVDISGPLPEAGTPILAGDKTVGELRSGQGDKALALIRLENLDADTPELHAGAATITPLKPDWAEI